MPVLIPCPICRQKVTVIRDGYVREHLLDGTLCTFTRTAHSTGASGLEMTPAQKQAAEENRVRARTAKNARKAAAAANKLKAEKPKRAGIDCPVCGRTVGGRPDRLHAHHEPTTKRWCSGGVEPSEQQRDAGKSKRSVWTISGGLPGLGKH